LKAAICEGELEPKQGWVSSDYGCHEPAPMVVYSLTARLPVRLITLLIPIDDRLASPPSVCLCVEDGCLHGLTFDDGREVIRADDLTCPSADVGQSMPGGRVVPQAPSSCSSSSAGRAAPAEGAGVVE
jgi:hypothetical protein